MENRTLGFLVISFLVILVFGTIIYVYIGSNSNDNESDTPSIIVAIAPNGTYEYHATDSSLSTNEAKSIIKNASNTKEKGVNGTIYGEKVTVKSVVINNYTVTIGYFQDDNYNYNESTLTSIANFEYQVAIAESSKALGSYKVSQGLITSEEAQKEIQDTKERLLKENEYGVVVYWNQT